MYINEETNQLQNSRLCIYIILLAREREREREVDPVLYRACGLRCITMCVTAHAAAIRAVVGGASGVNCKRGGLK